MLPITLVIAVLALIAPTSAHVSLISIYGSNNVIGHGFGVNLHGKYPRVKGDPGDAGGDSGIFQTGTNNPSPACGRTPELGPLDIPAWLDQAEGLGLPAAFANMSVVIEAFQVNRDGGGPMSCEYNEDATAATWKPMFMTLNQAGNSGIQNQVRTNETVVANFPKDAKCTGGWTQTACIVRCRTGVNLRFGGCFAVKLSGTTAQSLSTISSGANSPNAVGQIASLASASGNVLSAEQINSVAAQVIIQMKTQGLLISASASGNRSSPSLSPASLACISQSVQLSSASSVSASAAGAATSPNHSGSRNLTLDASDAADRQLYNSSLSVPANSSSVNSTFDASDAADNLLYNSTSSGLVHPTPAPAHPASDETAATNKHLNTTAARPDHPISAPVIPASSNTPRDASDLADEQLHSTTSSRPAHPAPNSATPPTHSNFNASAAADKQIYNSSSAGRPHPAPVVLAVQNTPPQPVHSSTTAGLTTQHHGATKRSRKCSSYKRKGH